MSAKGVMLAAPRPMVPWDNPQAGAGMRLVLCTVNVNRLCVFMQRC